MSGTWFTKDQIVNPDGTTENQINTTSTTTTGITPRVKLANELSWRSPGATFELTGLYNWQSGGTDQCGNLIENNSECPVGTSDPKYKSYGTTDFQAKWDPTKSFTGTIGVKDAFNANVALRQRRRRRLPGRLRSDLRRSARPFLVHQRDRPLLSLIGAVRRPVGLEARSRPCAGFFTSIAAAQERGRIQYGRRPCATYSLS